MPKPFVVKTGSRMEVRSVGGGEELIHELVIDEQETRPIQRRYTRESILEEMSELNDWYRELEGLLVEYDEKLAELEAAIEEQEMHLIVEEFCKNKELINTKEALNKWLLDTVESINMHAVAGPFVHEFEEPRGQYKGLTGIVVLAESHISIHTFPEYGYTFIDVFSCFWFDAWTLKEAIKQQFEMDIRNTFTIPRSIEEVV